MQKLRGVPLGVVLVAIASSAAHGEDLASFTATLDDLEAKAKTMEPGDALLASEIITANNALQEKLAVHSTKGTDPWKKAAQRSLALDKGVRARLEEPLAAGAPGRHAVAAKEKLDAAAEAVKVLKPGDKAGAERILGLLNAARASLSSAVKVARQSDLWKEGERRATEIDKEMRARYAATDGAKPAAAADGLDLDANPEGLPSTDLYYWRSFASAYRDAVADLRGGRLKDGGDLAASALERITQKDHKAVLRGKELVALYKKRLADARAEVKRLADAAMAREKLDVQEINKRLAELDAYFAKDFSAQLKPPCDAARVRAWIANLREWEALSEKGAAMIAKIKADFPRHADDPALKRMEQYFATGLKARIARDVRATTGRIEVGTGSTNGLLLGRIELAERYLAPDAFANEANVADDTWMGQALDELGHGIEACEALTIIRAEYEKKDPDPKLAKLAERLVALRDKQTAAATALYEKTRMPAASTTDAKTIELARAAVVGSGTPDSDILRLVVSWGPQDYEERRSSTTEAGSNMIRIESWTERGTSMQCTVAEKVKNDVRLVTYTLKLIKSGHPSSTKNAWFCSERFESRRIKPENVAK